MTNSEKRLWGNYRVFRALVSRARRVREDAQKAELLSLAAQFAVGNFPGVYSDWELEESLIQIAGRIGGAERLSPVRPGSCLHVMTRCAPVGGHTRVVERWMSSAESGERHSLALLGQEIPVPGWLTSAILGTGGELTDLSALRTLERALALRELASGYSYVVLHADMHDIVPVLAFGTPEFNRPVILYNHADHLFWVGVSVADIVADMGKIGKEITLTRRGARRSSILPVPLASPGVPASREAARARLGWGEAECVIVTSGTPHRFQTSATAGFIATVEEILRENPRARFVAIGPDPDTPALVEANTRCGGRISALGLVERDRFADLLAAADLYLDPFPLSSGTALLQVAMTGLPLLAFRNTEVLTPFDVFDTPDSQIADRGVLVRRAREILEGGQAGTAALRSRVYELHCPPGWTEQRARLVASLPARHSVSGPFATRWNAGAREQFVVGEMRVSGSGPHLSLLAYSRLALREKLFILRMPRVLAGADAPFLGRLAAATAISDYESLARVGAGTRRLIAGTKGLFARSSHRPT